MLRLNFGKAGTLLCKDALPEIVGVIQCIALVHHGHPAAMSVAAPPARQLEGIALNALHALAGVDVFLDRDFIGGAALELATDPDVRAFGVLPHHDQVDGGGVAQRGEPRCQQPGRPQVDPQIQLEAEAEQQPGRVLRIVDSGIADRPQVNRIQSLELAEDRIGQDLAGPQVSLGPQVVIDEIQASAGMRGHGLQDTKSLDDDLGANPIAGDDRDPKRHRLQHIGRQLEKVLRGLADTTT